MSECPNDYNDLETLANSNKSYAKQLEPLQIATKAHPNDYNDLETLADSNQS
jgi:hypothetical protein